MSTIPLFSTCCGAVVKIHRGADGIPRSHPKKHKPEETESEKRPKRTKRSTGQNCYIIVERIMGWQSLEDGLIYFCPDMQKNSPGRYQAANAASLFQNDD
jgi:hypothetical protein